MKTSLKDQIITEWLKTQVVHPSYRDIAKKLAKKNIKVTFGYCYQVVQEYLKTNKE